MPGPISHDAFPKTKALDPSKSGQGGKTITQTTRQVDSHAYAENVYPGGGTHPVNYGESPADQAEAQRCHDAFKEALDQNIHGYRFPGGKDGRDLGDGKQLNHNQDDFLGEIGYNPARSEKQRRFFGAELGRAKAGEPTQTGMSQQKLREFARKPKGGF